MDTDELEKEARSRAEKRVEEKLGFLKHLVVYIIVNAFLFVINAVTGPKFWWFLFPLGGWGIALVAHFVTVFVLGGGLVEEWRRKEIEKEAERLRRRG